MKKKTIGIHDIEGFKVGHAQKNNTGCTVIMCEEGAAAGCDVRGGGPATRETDLLKPENTVNSINAVLLSGGSAFGLDAATGVMRYFKERDMGLDVSPWKVPIVCSACIFDFPLTDGRYTPDAELGYEACMNASKSKIKEGNFGAGTGATVGKLFGVEYCMKSGIGSYGFQYGDLKVAAISCVNAFGDIYDYDSGVQIAGPYDRTKKKLLNTETKIINMREDILIKGNTTISVVATNASFSKTELTKISQICHDGYARVISPVHLTCDGDTIFTLSKGHINAPLDVVAVIASECISRAINRAVKYSTSVGDFIALKDIQIKED